MTNVLNFQEGRYLMFSKMETSLRGVDRLAIGIVNNDTNDDSVIGYTLW
jgi:hypothetical protein